jgi:hypothetical protein
MNESTFVALGSITIGASMVGFVLLAENSVASVVTLGGVVGGLAVALTGVLRLASVEPFTGEVSHANVISTAVALVLVTVVWIAYLLTSVF